MERERKKERKKEKKHITPQKQILYTLKFTKGTRKWSVS